jgi:outer membrane protein assembly factor BamB
MKSFWIAFMAGLPLAAGGLYIGTGGQCPFSCHAKASRKSADSAECKDGSCCQPTGRQSAFVSFVAASAADDAKPGPSDCPMFGGTPQRNMVNTIDKNVPTDFSVEAGKEKNVKWSALLGNKAYGGPVIAAGRVYVGTNNANPRNPGDVAAQAKSKDEDILEGCAVLMCFDEKDGKFLWQLKHQVPPSEIFKDARKMGLCSTPCVDSGHVYYVTPGCVLVCADSGGKIVWQVEMMKDLGVTPFHLGNCSPLVHEDLVFVVTGNGIDEATEKVHDPKAPSFAAFNKKTGKLAWKSDLPGEGVIEGQWSNPVLGTVGGKSQIIFPGGDSTLYSFEPTTGKLIWKFNCQPVRPKPNPNQKEIANYFISTPVVVDDRLYVGLGFYPGGHPSPTKSSHFLCIDITKTGDVSPKSLDAKDPANKASALVWAYGGEVVPRPKGGVRQKYFERTISTAAVKDGLVYIAEEAGYVHCLDAKTGQQYWDDDLKDSIWGSTYWVDGKVYVNNESGTVTIYEAGKKKNVVATVDLEPTMQGTPVVANGVLYLTTNSKLFAIVEKK